MYKNLAAALVAACFISPVFSQTAPLADAATEPLKAGFVYVAPLLDAGWVRQHDEGRKAVQEEVLARQKDIAAGKLHPFHARQTVLDSQGKAVIAKGQTLTDAQILKMNWLVQGVQGKLP